MKYCAYCGEKLEDTDRFCGNCGKPVRAEQVPRQRERLSSVPRQSSSSGLWGFLAGTGIGLFLSHLFGGSHSASASSNSSSNEHNPQTVIYNRYDDDDSDFDEQGYDSDSSWDDDISGSFDDHDSYDDNDSFEEQDYDSDSSWDDDISDGFDDYDSYDDNDSFDGGFDDY